MQHSLKFTLVFTAAAFAGLLAYGYSDSGSAGILLANAHAWKWGQREIVKGATVPDTSVLTGSEISELAVECPNHEVISYTCKQVPCNVHVCSERGENVERLTTKPPEPSYMQSLLAKLTRADNALVTPSVRGEANPNDAVLLEKGDELHLAPALNRLRANDYCFYLKSLDSSGSAPLVLKFTWNKEDQPEGIIKVPGLAPGSYTLEKRLDSAGACTADPNAVPAWVLIAPESQFSDLTAKWKANRSWFDALTDAGNSPALVATMRHATIAGLSQSITH